MAGSVRFTSLVAAAATGAGLDLEMLSPRYVHGMQVILTGAPTAVRVDLEGSTDGGTTWGKVGTWDTADGKGSGDFLFVEGASVNRLRANLVTLTGGTVPTVTANINSEPN